MGFSVLKYGICFLIGKTIKTIGFKPCHSHCIAEYDTEGFGRLDGNGFWQFPSKYGS